MLPIRTILHPTDFSEASDYAFRLACSLARDHGARVHVLHVGGEVVIAPVEGVVAAEPERYWEELTRKLHRIRADDPNVSVGHQLLLVGDPAAEILRVAQAIKSDLIVMGTHGRTGLSRLLMGSVAEQVVRRAACPVVTVKARPPQTGTAKELAAEPAREAAEVPRG
jgi:nucleotide-binding universal stress UspA family protein